VITLVKRLPLTQTAPSQPKDRHRSAPSPDARAETIRRNRTDTATRAEEVLTALARLLGRQFAREWFRAEG
jgi:hypothetical protein